MAQLVEDGGALAMPFQVQSDFWTFAAPWIPKSWHALVLALNKTPSSRAVGGKAAGKGELCERSGGPQQIIF